jgi:hypothetical protein
MIVKTEHFLEKPLTITVNKPFTGMALSNLTMTFSNIVDKSISISVNLSPREFFDFFY